MLQIENHAFASRDVPLIGELSNSQNRQNSGTRNTRPLTYSMEHVGLVSMTQWFNRIASINVIIRDTKLKMS